MLMNTNHSMSKYLDYLTIKREVKTRWICLFKDIVASARLNWISMKKKTYTVIGKVFLKIPI